MASSINAATSGTGGVITTADNSGILNIQTAGTTAVTVDASQNVGIGTSSPASGYRLVVNTTGATAQAAITAASGYSSVLSLGGNGTSLGSTSFDLVQSAGSSDAYVYNRANTNLIFGTNNAERMRIDSSGNVGIGYSSLYSSSKFQVQVSTGQGIFYRSGTFGSSEITFATNGLAGYATGTIGASDLKFNIGGTQAVTIDSSGNVLVGQTSTIYGEANRGTIELNGATNTLIALNIAGSTNNGSYFSNSASSFTTVVRDARPYIITVNSAERMRIDSSGKLLVGLTSSITGNLQVKNSDGGYGTGITLVEQGTSNYWSSLIYTVSHDYYIGYNGTNKGYFSSSTGAYTASSDKTLKKDIAPISYGLDAVLSFKPSIYLMKDDEENSKKHLGFIAQDLQEVVPEVVSEMQGGTLGVEAAGLIPILVKAIQELNAKVDALQAQLGAK
jgi:hypothetical protein